MDNLLYYPYINLPKKDWTMRTLLYYDRIGSIVPSRYFYNPEEYEPFMREMVRNELIIPIDPMQVLDHPWEALKSFIEYVNSAKFKLLSRRVAFFSVSGKIRNGQFPDRHPRIHIEKFDSEIFYQLEEAGLARRQDQEWYVVERQTAGELMTFLAAVIGGKLDYLPATDELKKEFRAAGFKKDLKSYRKQQGKRELILQELIPFPEHIDINKLRRFKDKHTDLLKSFKNKVELIALNPAIEPDSPMFSETIKELQTRKSELSAKMNESKLGAVFFGTICGIAGALAGLAATSTVSALLFGLPGFANAVYSALKLEKAEDVFDQSGMKYLALIDKKIKHPGY